MEWDFNWKSLSAKRLKHCRLVDDERQLVAATLFPMFDQQGQVKSVLVLDSKTARLYYFELRAEALSWSFWSGFRLAGLLQPWGACGMELMGDCWHFDPWWLLKAPQYAGCEYLAELKQTNCAEAFFDPVSMVYFRTDLSHVACLARSCGDGSYATSRIKSNDLPNQTDEGVAVGSGGRSVWQLKPFWQVARSSVASGTRT